MDDVVILLYSIKSRTSTRKSRCTLRALTHAHKRVQHVCVKCAVHTHVVKELLFACGAVRVWRRLCLLPRVQLLLRGRRRSDIERKRCNGAHGARYDFVTSASAKRFSGIHLTVNTYTHTHMRPCPRCVTGSLQRKTRPIVALPCATHNICMYIEACARAFDHFHFLHTRARALALEHTATAARQLHADRNQLRLRCTHTHNANTIGKTSARMRVSAISGEICVR